MNEGVTVSKSAPADPQVLHEKCIEAAGRRLCVATADARKGAWYIHTMRQSRLRVFIRYLGAWCLGRFPVTRDIIFYPVSQHVFMTTTGAIGETCKSIESRCLGLGRREPKGWHLEGVDWTRKESLPGIYQYDRFKSSSFVTAYRALSCFPSLAFNFLLDLQHGRIHVLAIRTYGVQTVKRPRWDFEEDVVEPFAQLKTPTDTCFAE